MHKKNYIPLYILAGLSVTSTMPIDLYSPTLPSIANWFSVEAGLVQLSVSAYLIGFTAGQVFYGALSDCYGRKPFLVAGLCIFLAATIACSIASSIEQLIAFRFVQGMGSAGAVVLARVMLLDTRHGDQAARDMAILSAIAMMSPIFSPILSGYVLVAGWQFIFWILAGLGAALLSYTLFLLPETNPAGGERRSTLTQALSGYLLVLRDATAVGYMLVLGLGIVGVVTFLTAAPFLFENIYHRSPQQFSYYLAFVMSGPAIGATISARQVSSRGATGMIDIGILVMAIASGSMVLFSWVDATLYLILGCAFFYAVGLSIAFPNIMTSLVGRFQKNRGAAAALLGVSQFLWSAISISIFSRIVQSSALPMALFVFGAGLSAGVIWKFTRVGADPSPRH